MSTDARLDRLARWLAIPALVVCVLFGAVTLSRGTARVDDTAADIRILELEFAGFTGGAEPLLAEITDDLIARSGADPAVARTAVEDAIHASLWWDFGFMLGYSLLLFSLARIVRTSFQRPAWQRAGIGVGWAALGAGVLDLIENVALFRVVADPGNDGWALLAAVAAATKWLIVVVAVGYIAAGFAAVVRSRRHRAAA